MSDKLSKRREASRKPSLAAVIYKYPSKTTERMNASEAEIKQVRSIEAEPTSPSAWNKLLDKVNNATY